MKLTSLELDAALDYANSHILAEKAAQKAAGERRGDAADTFRAGMNDWVEANKDIRRRLDDQDNRALGAAKGLSHLGQAVGDLMLMSKAETDDADRSVYCARGVMTLLKHIAGLTVHAALLESSDAVDYANRNAAKSLCNNEGVGLDVVGLKEWYGTSDGLWLPEYIETEDIHEATKQDLTDQHECAASERIIEALETTGRIIDRSTRLYIVAIETGARLFECMKNVPIAAPSRTGEPLTIVTPFI